MSKNIIIYKNSNGDSRTAGNDVSFEQFKEANDMHIADVKNVMNEIAYLIMSRGKVHDFTKKTDELQFYKDFMSTINDGTNFVEGQWYTHHVNSERHHLLSRTPNDVNLIDIIEMVVDCIVAGKARSGEIRDLELNEDILKLALMNTVKLIDDMIEVKDR